METIKNLYEILNLTNDASTKEIEEKYFFRKQSSKNKEEENLLEHAYSVLTDYHKRRKYDDNLKKKLDNFINVNENKNNTILDRLEKIENT